MDPNSPEFQALSSEVREQIVVMVLGILQNDDEQTERTVISGACAAMVQLAFAMRPDGMTVDEAAVRFLSMMSEYCRQFREIEKEEVTSDDHRH